MEREASLAERIRIQKRVKQDPIKELKGFIELFNAKNPEGKFIYSTPIKKGMDFLREKRNIEEGLTLLDYMQNYNRGAMRLYQDTEGLEQLLEKYAFFIQCVVYGFIHGGFKGDTRESKAQLYNEFGHKIQKLAEQLDLRGCTRQANNVYLIFGHYYIDKILLNRVGDLDIKEMVKFDNIQAQYGDEFIKRVYKAGIQQGVIPVQTQWIKWKIEAEKLLREEKKLQDSIAK